MIEELYDSGNEHRTLEKGEAVLVYKMDLLDYYRGWGYLGDGNGNITANLAYLPLEGTEYIWDRRLKCTDINMVKSKALSDWTDNTGRELNRVCVVTYTWTNSGRLTDTPRVNSAASWKLRFSYSMDIEEPDYWDDVTKTTGFLDTNENFWYTQMYSTEWTSLKTAYNTAMTALQADPTNTTLQDNLVNQEKAITSFRDNHELPRLEFRKPHWYFHFTFYTDRLLPLGSYMCTINSDDFITQLYARRDAGLLFQGKQSSYVYNYENIDDVGKWMLISVEDTRNFERGTQFFEYNLTFEWNPLGWNKYPSPTSYSGGAFIYPDCKQYYSSTFYNIVSGIDLINVLPEYEY